MEFIGVLKQKLDERSGVSQRGPWKIATYLLETVSMYQKHMVVDVSDGESGRIAKFDALVGKNVHVWFECDAREYNGKWYNTLRGSGIAEVTQAQAGEQQQAVSQTTPSPAAPSHEKKDVAPATEATEGVQQQGSAVDWEKMEQDKLPF